ncbi:MYO10 protein, partial [Gymnorhina tibicen]|nr:MYO10 protein [Gymnorhina tibicen]
MVLRGYVPTSEETLQTLAALRLQSLNSDFSTHAPFPRLEELFPPHVLHARLPPPPHRPPTKCRGARLRAGLLAGGLWGQALAKQRAERDQRLRGRLREEGASTMAAIVEKWKLLQGMGRPEAMAAYVALVREWPGFGSTLFDVDLHAVRPRLGVGQGQPWPWATLTPLSPQSPVGSGPQRLWLGIGAKAVSLYKPGEPEPLDSFCYGRISSFGASDSSTFRLSVEDRDLLFETSQVRGCHPSTLPSPRVPQTDPLCPLYLQVDEIAQLLHTYLASAGAQRLPRPQEPPTSSPTSEPTVLPQGLCPAAEPWQHRPPVGSSHS